MLENLRNAFFFSTFALFVTFTSPQTKKLWDIFYVYIEPIFRGELCREIYMRDWTYTIFSTNTKLFFILSSYFFGEAHLGLFYAFGLNEKHFDRFISDEEEKLSRRN